MKRPNAFSEPVAIVAGAAYQLPEFMQLARLGQSAMREAREKGLKVRQVGRNRYVVGDDWLDFLAEQPPVK